MEVILRVLLLVQKVVSLLALLIVVLFAGCLQAKSTSLFFFFSTVSLKSTYIGILSLLVNISVEHMTGKTKLFRAVGFKEFVHSFQEKLWVGLLFVGHNFRRCCFRPFSYCTLFYCSSWHAIFMSKVKAVRPLFWGSLLIFVVAQKKKIEWLISRAVLCGSSWTDINNHGGHHLKWSVIFFT